MLAGLVLGAIQAQLSSATVRIDLSPSSATVRAEYRFRAAPDSGVSFVLFRLPGQTIEGLETPNGAAVALSGMTRIRGAPDQTGVVSIRFRVGGDRGRIAIPVPVLATDGRSKRVEIQISGDRTAVDLGEAFPRFAPEEGLEVARLANVPSVVQLPPRRSWPFLELVDWAVVVMVIGGALGWVASRGRRT